MLGNHVIVSALVALMILAGNASAALSPGQKCAATKTKETGKKIYCKAKCDSKAVKRGDPVDSLCLSKCHDKFAAKFAKAEAKGGCATVGDEAPIEAKVDAHLADLEATLQLGGPSACTATKYKEAGKKGYCRLKCHVKAKKKALAVDPTCLQKCTDKFTAKCASAEGLGDCIAAAACATLEAKVDAFVDDVAAELPSTPPTFQACPADPSRTIYAGDQGTSPCQQFENQMVCEQAFHETGSVGDFASCYWTGSDCRGCGPNNRQEGLCINTCVEGPTPICAGDPGRTTFAGFSGTQACHQFDGDQSSCEQAFHMGSTGVESSCWWDAGSSECRGCGPSNQQNGDCVNSCPVCLGDGTRTIFTGGPGTSACHVFDGDQTSCEQAFHVSGAHGNSIASCYYDTGSSQCQGCGDHGDPSVCSNTCAVCPDDPTRTHVPGHTGCGFYNGSASLCSGAFTTDLNDGGGSISCEYDVGTDECSGCDPYSQTNGLCVNTCEGPICGDNQVNLGEECDGTDDSACSAIALGCRGDCRCERCTNGSVDPGEACDTPGSQGTCPAGTTCNDNCTVCLTICGDGTVSGSEVCDPAAPGSCPVGESCLGCSACQAICGDGLVSGSEVCDYTVPGSCPVGESCNFSCSACQAVCGDGLVGGSEVCDYNAPGSCPVGESCDFSCSACQTVCGDGLVGGSEVCDPPGQQGACPLGQVCDVGCSSCVTCPTATVIGSAGGAFTGSTVGGYTLAGSCGGSSSSPERYFEWTPNVSHVATIQTCGGTTNYDTVLYIWQGSACGAPVITCNDDYCGLASTINPFVTAGTTYTIVVDGFGGSAGNFTLTVSPSGAFIDDPFE